MKTSQPPILATKLLERLASGPHGDALAGDLIERYREGRSPAWYWRQALLAIVISFAKDRTLGGPAILGSLLVLLLMVVSVARHPSSLGTGLFIMDITLLSGYCVLSVWGWRQRRPAARNALTAGARTGIILGLVLVASHAVEWFALDGGRTAQFVRGAGSTLLILGLLGAAGSAAWERTRSTKLGVIAGLWCGSLGMMILLSFALALNLAFEAHSVAWLSRSLCRKRYERSRCFRGEKLFGGRIRDPGPLRHRRAGTVFHRKSFQCVDYATFEKPLSLGGVLHALCLRGRCDGPLVRRLS